MAPKAPTHLSAFLRSFRIKWIAFLFLVLALLTLILRIGSTIKQFSCVKAYRARHEESQQQKIDALRQAATASRSAGKRTAPNVYFPSAEDLSKPTAWPAVEGVLSSGAGDIPILTYGLKDKYISRNILWRHYWENEIRDHMMRVMKQDPSIGLIDLGCNIGVYALTAAKHGRKVVAVDANRYNLLMLGQSLTLNPGLKERVTMVHNALSNEYGRVQIGIVAFNIGGSGVTKIKASTEKVRMEQGHSMI